MAYSGGDDCHFKGWDLRQPASATFCNCKAHSAGVCCIAPHPSKPHVVATGSYDDQARIWDLRNTAAPVCTSQAGAKLLANFNVFSAFVGVQLQHATASL